MFGITPFERNDIWNPIRDFERDFFRSFSPVTHCRTDIRDEGDKFLLECEMPGFEKEDIKISVDGSTLSLCAERKYENDQENSGGEYIRRERSYGSYCRSFDISNVDESAIDASYNNGVLKLTLPKKANEKAQSRQIEIR